METKNVLFTLDEQDTEYVLLESKAREGNLFNKNDVLYSIKSINTITQKTRVIHIRAEDDGKLLEDYCAISGTELEPGVVLCKLKMCSHAIVLMDLCTDCGKKMVRSSTHKKVVLGGLNKTVQLSPEEFKKWRFQHNRKLIESRKLVLVLDLDNTLLETFCFNNNASNQNTTKHSLLDFLPFTEIKDSSAITHSQPSPPLQQQPSQSDDSLQIPLHVPDFIKNYNTQPVMTTAQVNKGYICFNNPSKPHLTNIKLISLLTHSEKSSLLNFMERNNQVQAFTIENDTKNVYYIKTRPFIKQLICLLAPKYNLFVYTLGKRDYANKALSLMGLDKMIQPDCIVCGDDNSDISHKELTRLVQCDDNFVVVLDDRADIWNHNLRNLIRVKHYSYWKELFVKYKMLLDKDKSKENNEDFIKNLVDSEKVEENYIKKIAHELELLYDSVYKEKEVNMIDLRDNLDMMKSTLFNNARVYMVAAKILPDHIEEMRLHGAMVYDKLTMENINEINYIIVLRLDLLPRGLAHSGLKAEDLSVLRHTITNMDSGIASKFLGYSWVENSIGCMEKQDTNGYVIKKDIVRRLIGDGVEAKKKLDEDTKMSTKEGGVIIMKSKEIANEENNEHQLTKELEDELEIDNILRK
eukprot:GAHX01001253.1.p1 GENE.GAHX01001253.1~~GAHX01001253.1.p1  ORF type:complete len:637 (-),score=136.96 GAHX01001253.1:29-1939(-)